MDNSDHPLLIDGGNHIDERGKINFANDFHLDSVRRFYLTEHFDKKTVRAWQLHIKERRWFYCAEGGFDIRLVKISNSCKAPLKPKVIKYKLNYNEPKVLCIPPGYANGFKALKDNSKLVIFADYHFGENPDDQIRFDKNLWTRWDK